jgi:hypothetical protein
MNGRATNSEERLALAQGFLRDAVFRSRATQATGGVFASKPDGEGRCGLGDKAALVRDLTEEGANLFKRLWPDASDADVERIRARMNAWVVEQDALDRKRNHFIKAFRQKHGFDRVRWSREQSEEFDFGLAKVNAGEDDARRRAALDLLQLAECTRRRWLCRSRDASSDGLI